MSPCSGVTTLPTEAMAAAAVRVSVLRISGYQLPASVSWTSPGARRVYKGNALVGGLRASLPGARKASRLAIKPPRNRAPLSRKRYPSWV
jgi:hypothetical protein